MAKEINTEKQAEVIVEAVSKTELFFQENKKNIITVLAVLVIAGAAFFAWHKFAYLPKVEEAQKEMLVAEASFLAQEYELALNGNESAAGFAQIISEYGNKAGAAANLYAGICEYNLGNFDSAIKYLEAYKGSDEILSARAIAAIGDCYVAKEDYNKAVTYFEKAAAHADNMYAATYLLKAGVTYEELGQADKALSCYKKIKDQYEQSLESYEIDKYISRIENK